jgi:glycosyltransferase involved in cell wall biosynthesis
MPSVLILMPVLNESQNIEESIGSIQAQSFKEWTLVIQDNLSDDDTVEIVGRLLARDSRIKLLKNTARLNLQENWASLATEALTTYDSTYVIWMGGDDLWSTKDFLINKINKLEQSSNLSCVTSGVRNFGGEGGELILVGTSSGIRFRRLYDYLRDYRQINVLWALTPRDKFLELVNHKCFYIGGFSGFDWYFCLGLFFTGRVGFDPDSIYLKRARAVRPSTIADIKSSLGISSYKAFMVPYRQTFWAQRARLLGLPVLDALLIVTWQIVASHLRLLKLMIRKFRKTIY